MNHEEDKFSHLKENINFEYFKMSPFKIDLTINLKGCFYVPQAEINTKYNTLKDNLLDYCN
jgi:hypothetical protein